MAYKQRTGVTAASQLILTDDPDFLGVLVERVIQEILEAEMTAHLHADPSERSADRRGYRNGYKSRQLNTRVGTLTLQVPQDRDGTFSTQVFTRYQRNEKALVLALMEMSVEGVSTRKVREITEVLCGTSFSKSLVSELGLPHETAKIVRQGGNGKKHERRSIAAYQTGVYPSLICRCAPSIAFLGVAVLAYNFVRFVKRPHLARARCIFPDFAEDEGGGGAGQLVPHRLSACAMGH